MTWHANRRSVTLERQRRAPAQPVFHLRDRNELQASAPNPTQLWPDVLVEEITTASPAPALLRLGVSAKRRGDSVSSDLAIAPPSSADPTFGFTRARVPDLPLACVSTAAFLRTVMGLSIPCIRLSSGITSISDQRWAEPSQNQLAAVSSAGSRKVTWTSTGSGASTGTAARSDGWKRERVPRTGWRFVRHLNRLSALAFLQPVRKVSLGAEFPTPFGGRSSVPGFLLRCPVRGARKDSETGPAPLELNDSGARKERNFRPRPLPERAQARRYAKPGLAEESIGIHEATEHAVDVHSWYENTQDGVAGRCCTVSRGSSTRRPLPIPS
jgi:hypothetical protein